MKLKPETYHNGGNDPKSNKKASYSASPLHFVLKLILWQ
jgi:hypothetical protein